MKTTVKLLVSAVALCIVPVTYAITPEQAAANLQGAQQFSHLADKSYSTAMYNEHIANIAMGNAIVMHGQNSTEALNATQAYDAALKQVAQTRQDARLGRLQVDAANHALITATRPPVPTVNPTLYRQIIARQQAALIAPSVVNPTTTTTLQTVPTVNPTLYRQIIASQQAALIAPPVVNPTTTTTLQTVPTVDPALYRQIIASQQAALIAPPVVNPTTTTTLQTVPTVDPTLYRQIIASQQAALIAPPVVNPTTTTTLQTVPTVNPTLYRQIIASQQAALIAPPVVNPVIPPQTGQPSVNTKVVLPGVVTSTQKQVINSYYVDQNTRNKVSNNSIAISQNNQRIDRNTREIEITRNKVSSNSDAISQNSQKIDRNEKDIEDTRDDLKRGLNNAAAMSSLHYHSDNAWALSTGTANGDGAALAGGLQKGLTSHVAVNMQASTSFDSGWMAGAGISGDF